MAIQRAMLENVDELGERNFSVSNAERVYVGFKKWFWVQRDDVPPEDYRGPGIGLLCQGAGRKCRCYVHRVHATDADDIGTKLDHLSLQWGREPFIDDSNNVTGRFERGGYVFETQRLNSEEWPKTKPFIRRSRSNEEYSLRHGSFERPNSYLWLIYRPALFAAF
jgi:hypothetical protein